MAQRHRARRPDQYSPKSLIGVKRNMASAMSDLWQKIKDTRNSVLDLPRQGLTAAMNKENELEHSALQKGLDFAQDHGVISADTGKGIMDAHTAVEGIKSSYANMVGGSAKIL